MESSLVRVKFAFREAVEKQDHTTLKMLMNNHAGTAQLRKVVAKELFDGFTPLQQACLSQNKEIVVLFVEHGLEVEHKGKYGWTALHAASFACKPGNDISIISLLLNSCASVAARDDHGCLPIDLAENSEVKEVLLAKMEEKGHSELVDMYRKLQQPRTYFKNDLVKRWVEGGIAVTRDNSENKENRAGALYDAKALPPRDFVSNCFYTACEQRERLVSDRPALRRDRERGRRRVASWNIKSRRDSGISLDNSDSFTYI